MFQVNGESVIGMPHHKAVALVKKAQGIVQLAVSRCDSIPCQCLVENKEVVYNFRLFLETYPVHPVDVLQRPHVKENNKI